MTDYVCNPSNYRPWIHHTLPSSDQCLSLNGAVIEPSYHFTSDYFSILLKHLQTDPQYHQHVVNSVDPHSIDVTDSVATSNSPLHIRVIYQGVEKVCCRNEVLCWVVEILCHATIRSLLSNGAVPDIFQVLEESSGRDFASSSL